MTKLQKGIQYLAMTLAILLSVTIIGGILGVVGLFGGFFAQDAVTEECKSYAVTSQVRQLYIRIHAADLSIKEGETFSVESNLKHLKVEEKGDVLTVEETTKFPGTYHGAVLTVYLPADLTLDNTSLSTGAGRLTVEKLSSHTLDMELGAGEASVSSLVATGSADIEGGAGRITIADGALCNLDLEMGVGQLNLTSALTGNCHMELGVGETNLTLLGHREDYAMELEKGIGRLCVDGKDVSDFGSTKGTNRVEIHGGIGAIYVNFEEPEAK